jgi:hypothetical protein
LGLVLGSLGFAGLFLLLLDSGAQVGGRHFLQLLGELLELLSQLGNLAGAACRAADAGCRRRRDAIDLHVFLIDAKACYFGYVEHASKKCTRVVRRHGQQHWSSRQDVFTLLSELVHSPIAICCLRNRWPDWKKHDKGMVFSVTSVDPVSGIGHGTITNTAPGAHCTVRQNCCFYRLGLSQRWGHGRLPGLRRGLAQAGLAGPSGGWTRAKGPSSKYSDASHRRSTSRHHLWWF